MNTINVLKAIADARSELRKSEQKVADYVLAQPKDVIHMRIVDLAAEAQVSQPTVVRFCRALHYDGFQDFKLTLAQVLGSNSSFEQFALDNNDTVSDLKKKIFDSTIGNLINIRDGLDSNRLEQAIEALTGASRVEFYGFGASAAVCTDAQHKFHRLRVNAVAYSDPHLQSIAAVTLTAGDVVVAVSQTGRTKDLLHSARLAMAQGAQVIALCPSNTPLSEQSSIPIHIDLEEDKDLSALMSSRVVQLVVIDVLAVGLAMKLGPGVIDHLKAIRRSLRSLRLNEKKPTQP
ncbi:MAG: RpiR family carbohydrate utilization transcriptional regulator [Motiliproteus sp.]